MNKYLSIITLNVSVLSAPIKRHRIAEWIQSMTYTCAPYKRPISAQKTYTDWRQIFQANRQEKNAGVAILISDKIDFKKRAIKRDLEDHFIVLKGRIHQEDINIVNIYATNIGAPRYIRKILEDFKKDIDSNTILLGDFNTPLSNMDRSSKQNINMIMWH